MVPLYDTYEKQNLEYCLDLTNMEVVFCKRENVDILVSLDKHSKLRTIVSFEEITEQ